MTEPGAPETVAAVDLGSNSFHMIVARVDNGHVHVVDKLKEMVRLGGGLDHKGRLTPEAMERALACLERFGQRVRSLPHHSVRAIGTNTLRQARNADEFLPQAEEALGHSIEIVAGREEARLIYLGVAHSLASGDGRRLVVDIGGGSTELIIGEGFEPIERESLHMGCVSMTRRVFGDGRITRERWDQAVTAAMLEIQPIRRRYRALNWGESIGASGTILAVAKVLRENGWTRHGITPKGLASLRDLLIEQGGIDKLEVPGLGSDRVPVFVGGAAVLAGVFEGLAIEQMEVSDGALREGAIYDLIGRIRHQDVREHTVDRLQRRFDVDAEHGARVRATAWQLFDQVRVGWGLNGETRDLLGWAAALHEIGLSIAHSQYHKHGAYLLEYADLPGFSRSSQTALAALVRLHRRKANKGVLGEFRKGRRKTLLRLTVLLRLAVLFNRSRDDQAVLPVDLKPRDEGLTLRFAAGELDRQPLTRADLENEADALLRGLGFELSFS
jgi:exopolyphosphatase/guanosine-5'-triphosphate,3'-diphosphate pyrophosphatase